MKVRLPMAKSLRMPPLPPELWSMIAGYLEDEDLDRLLGLNRVFYELVIRRWYHEFSLIDSNPRRFMRKVEALRDSPHSALVQTLRLWPSATWNAIDATSPPDVSKPLQTEPIQAVTHKNKPSRFLFRVIRQYLSRLNQPNQRIVAVPAARRLDFSSPQEKQLAIIDAARNLVNVKDLDIRWEASWVRYSRLHTPHRPCCPFLAAFLPTLGCSNLRSLTLNLPSSVLEEFLPSPTNMISLQDLSIRFSLDRSGIDGQVPGPNSMDPLAPFINGLSNTLKSLSLETYDHIYFSPFFNSLGEFPYLSELSLTMAFDSRHIPDLSGLKRLLRQRNLQHLTIRDHRCERFRWAEPHDHVPSTQMSSKWVEEWVEECFKRVSLQALQLGSKRFFTDRHLTHIKHLSRSLTSLAILEIRLSFTEVAKVLTALTGGTSLESLSLVVKALSPELFHLLASRCPTLKRLVLDADNVRLVEGSSISSSVAQLCAAMHNHRDSHQKLYDSWSLSEVEIWMWEYGVGLQLQWDLMRTIVHGRRTIENFAG